MLAFQAFHLAAYHFSHGTSALGCSELDGLLSGGPGPADLNAALDVCFDPLFSCSHAQVQPAMCVGEGVRGEDGDDVP